MRFNLPEIQSNKLLSALRGYDLLPAIVFVPSRRRCDEMAVEAALDPGFQKDLAKKEERQRMFDSFAETFPEIKKHKHSKILLRAGIASHHAGHIPVWKLVVEKMMSSGLLNAIFATSTVAAGVDFPARTVVVSHADTRGNEGWRPLFASEVQQMTGRAGRRGRDNVGFVILAPGRFQNPPKIAELLQSPSDALESKFRANYTSLLNLLDAFGDFANVRSIAEKSFAFRETARQIARLRSKAKHKKEAIRKEIELSGLDIGIEEVLGYERLFATQRRLQTRIPATREDLRLRWLKKEVKTGRVISRGKAGKRFLVVLDVQRENVTAMKENFQGVTFPLQSIKRIYSKTYDLSDDSGPDPYAETSAGKNPIVVEPGFAEPSEPLDESERLIENAIERLSGEGRSDEAVSLFVSCASDAGVIWDTERDIMILRDDIWSPFLNQARVLDHYGYLDFAGQKVTESGKWLADLRLDNPLLVGEAIKRELLKDAEVPATAGFMAALAADPERDYGELEVSVELGGLFRSFKPVFRGIGDTEWKCGVAPAEGINFSAAATAEYWAAGAEWEELVFLTRAEEGDLVRLLSRTGEALMQIAHLSGTNEAIAAKARETADVVLREPIR
ncbi:MAG: hypothetical protein R2684_14075 [Pyrinomonadaceae bacterium]